MSRQWFVLQVQSGREDSIRRKLEKRALLEGLDETLITLLVPTEKVTEIRSGKKRTVQRKTLPGYLMAEIEVDPETGEIPDDVWFLIRETRGIGSFVGSQERPMPMAQHEVDKMLAQAAKAEEEEPELDIPFVEGDSVRIKEGHLSNLEGTIEEVFPNSGRVKVMVMIFGRPTPVELEYWKVEPA